jgi:superfamily II DNA or RNA helicase
VRINREKLDLETVKALREMFTHKNPKFLQAKRMGFSTWKTPPNLNSFSLEDPFLLFPRGALNRITELLESRGYEIEAVVDRSLKLERMNLELAYKLYSYQQEAVDAVVRSGNCVMRGPCGSGKTICLLGIIAALKQPTLVIVHTEALKKQWASVVSDWLGFIPGSLGGKDKPNVRPITIGMQQTIWRWAKKDPPWAKKFGCIIGDEVHHWASRTFQDTATMFPAAYRVGASADEKRKDGLEHMIYDTFGPCVYEIKRQELIDMNRLLPVDMLLVRTGYENEGYLSDMEEGIPPDWNKMLNELTTDEDRNEVIKQTSLRLLAEPKNRLLMLSERVQTCHEWKEVFDSHGHPCRVMVGGNKNETEQAISDLRTGKIRIAVGTKIADEGLDIPQLTHVLVTCPVHTHPKRLEQMVGRAARVWEGKMQATAIYFWDSGMFPMPTTYSDDPFKKRGRKSAFFRNLRKACSTLQEWDIDTDEIFDVK